MCRSLISEHQLETFQGFYFEVNYRQTFARCEPGTFKKGGEHSPNEIFSIHICTYNRTCYKMTNVATLEAEKASTSDKTLTFFKVLSD